MHRRRFLRVGGVLAAGGIAGCFGDGGDSAGGTPIDEHPAAADLDEQPRRGDLDGHVVIAFEDPSCSRCRAFERNTVPKLLDRLVASGSTGFVVRTYPVIYPWGQPATQALEATFARDADAFWALHGHYFDRQDEFTTGNVLDRTAAFLDDETAVDGAAVAADAEAKAYDAAVQADLDAGEAAGIGRTTPIAVLFKDGRYTTEAAGSVSYELIATALGEA